MSNLNVDILAIGAHPDDVELGCSGTIAKEIALGKKVGIIDLTRGELGTRGTAEIRDSEAKKAASILGVSTLTYLPFCFFNIISPFMTMMYAIIGIKIKTIKA